MICPKCGSEHIEVQVVNEVKEKNKKGWLYWLIIGWWWEPLAWLFFTVFKLLFAIFGHHKKITSKTVAYAVCQECGYRWKV